MRSILLITAAAAIAITPAMAESNRKERQDDGVQRAIAYQRAKDRADALQARKEGRHPEHFSQAQPQQNGPNSLANEQKKETLEHSPKTADRQQ